MADVSTKCAIPGAIFRTSQQLEMTVSSSGKAVSLTLSDPTASAWGRFWTDADLDIRDVDAKRPAAQASQIAQAFRACSNSAGLDAPTQTSLRDLSERIEQSGK